MTSDNIVPLPVKYRGSPRSSKTVEAELARAERIRAFRALNKTIEETKSIDLASRARLAKRLGALYDELKASGNIRGTIGKIFESAGLVGNSDTSPSKQLSRYVVKAGKPLIEKGLSSNPRNYERLAVAFANALGRDSEEVALQAFQGIFDGGAASGSASIEAEGLYDHLAIRLNSICNGIAHKHELDASFRAAIGWGLGMGQDDDWAPNLGYARFHPDKFTFDHWRLDEDNDSVDGMLPKVALVDWTIEVPVKATSRGVPGDEPAPDSVAFWMRNGSDFGMESTQIRITQFVEIAIVPGSGGRPIPALIERYQTLIGDVPLTQWRSLGDGYFVFTWEPDNVRDDVSPANSSRFG